MPSLPRPSSTNISATRRAARRRGACAVAAGALAALLACSVAFAAPAIVVTNARIRLLPGDLPLGGYFDLVNRGRRPAILTAASSPAFKTVDMHRSIERDGTATMDPAENIKIKPGATLHFAPGGYHLMLMQRVKPLRVGDKVPITLRFADRQTLRIIFEVKSAEIQ